MSRKPALLLGLRGTVLCAAFTSHPEQAEHELWPSPEELPLRCGAVRESGSPDHRGEECLSPPQETLPGHPEPLGFLVSRKQGWLCEAPRKSPSSLSLQSPLCPTPRGSFQQSLQEEPPGLRVRTKCLSKQASLLISVGAVYPAGMQKGAGGRGTTDVTLLGFIYPRLACYPLELQTAKPLSC